MTNGATHTLVGFVVRWFAHGRTDETFFDTADEFPANAMLTRMENLRAQFCEGRGSFFRCTCGWQWSQWRKHQGGDDGGDDLFVRLLENCLGRLLRADVCRPVQGNLFPCASVTLGSGTTKQIP